MDTTQMDFVVVTHGPDVKLLRHCLHSYDVYFNSKGKIFIFITKRDARLLDRIHLPKNVELLYIDEIPGVHKAKSGLVEQIYLKMLAHHYVTTEHYCIIDSDFLFLRPTYARDFYLNDKPVWFYTNWLGHEQAMRWKSDSEMFLGFDIQHLFLEFQQNIFIRDVARKLEAKYPLERILTMNMPSEYLIYGAYSFKYHRDRYEFVPEGGKVKPICKKVNQIPPTYCHLDPNCCYQDFLDAHYVVFWSHWDLAEKKMIEFFEDSQRDHFGKVMPCSRDRLLELVDPADIMAGNYWAVGGTFSDGWLQSTVRMTVKPISGSREIILNILVPANPHDCNWRLEVKTTVNSLPQNEILLEPGTHRFPIPINGKMVGEYVNLSLSIGPGFYNRDQHDNREFRAHLDGIEFSKIEHE